MVQPLSEEQARQIGELRNVLYRAHPTHRDYSFTFSFVNPGWRVYINNSPDYGPRASGSIASHRLEIGNRPYICWKPNASGRTAQIPTLSEAQAVAALWADSTENYIATGRFEPAAGRPQVQDRSVLNGYVPTTAQSGPRPSQHQTTPLSRPQTIPPPRRSFWADVRDALFN